MATMTLTASIMCFGREEIYCASFKICDTSRMCSRENAKKEEGDEVYTTIYMDDRSWAASSPKACVEEVLKWREWSVSVRLQENEGKTQLAANSKEAQEALRAEAAKHNLEEFVKPTIEILGAESSISRGRKQGDKEKKRLKEAKSTMAILRVLPIARHVKVQYCRAFGISKAAYGWIARAPTQAEAKRYGRVLVQGWERSLLYAALSKVAARSWT